jgi:hypothetical protein
MKAKYPAIFGGLAAIALVVVSFVGCGPSSADLQIQSMQNQLNMLQQQLQQSQTTNQNLQDQLNQYRLPPPVVVPPVVVAPVVPWYNSWFGGWHFPRFHGFSWGHQDRSYPYDYGHGDHGHGHGYPDYPDP